jgi:hypothetical protein
MSCLGLGDAGDNMRTMGDGTEDGGMMSNFVFWVMMEGCQEHFGGHHVALVRCGCMLKSGEGVRHH